MSKKGAEMTNPLAETAIKFIEMVSPHAEMPNTVAEMADPLVEMVNPLTR